MRTHRILNRLAYYTAVIDTGSFTAAAERLGVTKAVVSQQVAKLEKEVGATLLARTTRNVKPTETGRIFYARCAAILRESEDAIDELAQATSMPNGTLRITAPFDYGCSVVAPAVSAFTRRYPSCEATLTLNDKTLDLVSEQLDMAIRVGWVTDSNLQARRIGSFRQLLVCSPGFADAIASASGPEDIEALPFVANMALRKPLCWQFSRGDNEQRTVCFRSTIAIDATPAVHAAVLAGAGLSVLPDFLVFADLAAGRLLQVLQPWELPAGGIHTVFPAARFRPAKVTAFVDMLTRSEKARQAAIAGK